MGFYCRYCHGRLTRNEFFLFNNSCMLCEEYKHVARDERQLLVKSPLYALRALSFYSRRVRNRVTGYLRNINIV